MDLVDEQDPWNNRGFALFLPFVHLGIDLLTKLWLDLARVACKEGKEALCSGIDDVDFVEGDGMGYDAAML